MKDKPSSTFQLSEVDDRPGWQQIENLSAKAANIIDVDTKSNDMKLKGK